MTREVRHVVLSKESIIALSNNEPVDIGIDARRYRLCTDEYMNIATNEKTEKRLVAHWIDNSDGGRICNPPWDRYICSNCGRHSDLENYCCNCGAEMEDKE